MTPEELCLKCVDSDMCLFTETAEMYCEDKLDLVRQQAKQELWDDITKESFIDSSIKKKHNLK